MSVLVKSTLAGGFVAFFWMMISWSALPWHFNVLNEVPGEAEVGQALKSQITNPGVYVLPNPKNPDMELFHQKMAAGPFAYMLVLPNGVSPQMPVMMGMGLLLNFLTAFMLSWMLVQTKGLNFKKRVLFVVVGASAGTIFAHVGYQNWWFFPLDYTLIYVLDMAIGWTLAGAAMAKVIPSN